MRVLPLLVLALMATASPGVSSGAWAAEPPAGAWTPETIPWQTQAPNGTRYALLEGSRDTPGGVFTYAFFIPAGVWDAPHWHSTTARVVVLKGALGLGYGEVPDRTKVTRYGTGAVVIVPGGARHFDGADEDTIILGVATGRWSTTYLDGSRPASAGTPVPPK
jgi:quercetin dioxygenase-like cupin family protein